MVIPVSYRNPRPVWFAGCSYGGTEDQSERFLNNGIWENGYIDRYLDEVRSIRPGDRIALKTTYVRKNGLPFDNRGHSVSVMAIKATGIVTENLGDGRNLDVDWTPVNPPREWYFYTNRRTVWQVRPDNWVSEGLIGFAFDNQPQDIDSFRNDPKYRDRFGDPSPLLRQNPPEPNPAPAPEPLPPISEAVLPYTIDDIISDGCFLERRQLTTMLDRLAAKRNIILQGSPGTGKTWLAKRLAYALVGSRDDDRVRPLQFHPNMSYEDFVRGWRPAGAGQLDLVDGPFLRLMDDAGQNPDVPYVMVIEEINRGNPAQIFGEMLTLLEADKRHPGEALALAYPRAGSDGNEERVHIPPNVYVIGTMNVADRSLALVDFALRRRFAFFDLEPVLDDRWRNWVSANCGLPADFLSDVGQRLTALNQRIAADRMLGKQFRIGHSAVTPPRGAAIGDPREWFAQVVDTEIAPLLDEYWFDNPEAADDAKAQLLAGL